MNIPPKYEYVVAKLDAALGRETALREELEKFRSGCVDLSSQVRELEHKMDYYKGEGLRADALQQRLTVAEQRAGDLVNLMREVVEDAGIEFILSADTWARLTKAIEGDKS